MKLQVNNLGFRYPKAEDWTIKGITFELNQGEILSILGPNGAGKKTLLNCLAGLFNMTEGDMLLNGKSLNDFMASLETKYTQMQVDEMILDANDTVLDVGCGIGRLTIPVAKKVKNVTAIDVADGILEYCRKNIKKAGLTNVDVIHLDWNEIEVGRDLPKHDVVFASRSVGLKDLIKLNNAANKYAFVLSFAGYPSLRNTQMDLLAGIIEENQPLVDPYQRMFGYNVVFNLLYDMGIDPMVKVLTDGFERVYKTREDAYEDLGFLTQENIVGRKITEEEKAIFRHNVDKYLNEESNGEFRFLRQTKTYVIGWETNGMELI